MIRIARIVRLVAFSLAGRPRLATDLVTERLRTNVRTEGTLVVRHDLITASTQKLFKSVYYLVGRCPAKQLLNLRFSEVTLRHFDSGAT